MDFGKFIHELLLENEIVIIPGFGAFVSEYKPAEINEESDEIKPPSKIILFNQQIRNNDGLLVGHVAETKRISHFDALKQIEKERDEILYKLDSGEKVELTDIGVLFHTEENTIGFKSIDDENMLLDSFGLEATSITAEEEIPEENTTEEEPVAPPVSDEENTETHPSEQVEAEQNEDKTTPVDEPVVQSTIIPPKEEEKKKGWWWLLFIFIPLLAVSVFVYIQGQKEDISKPAQEPETAITPILQPADVPQDMVESDTVTIAESDTVTTTTELVEAELAVENIPNAPKYYLVGGSFSVEENAEIFMDELKAKGLKPFHAGKKGRFFIVGIAQYDTFNEAEQAKVEYMKEHPGSEVWVWKK
ncbi:SPOR domain-containing protein [Prolixibacteraceae bacterium Z1-6]|uniref:SPOR domain-containing protein n=1 Tax=Draconibacterium aestuarii TaxID=2998507 RepID=A0A9X3F687_9BACT|nr:SPOR domain-containing protein [Prolixibacteraceae bacterium Z1-6]